MRQQFKIYLLLLFIGCLATGLQAQEETTNFNLDQAIAYAMTNSYVLKNTSKDIQLSQEKVWETITTGLPQVSGSFDYSKNILAAKSPFPVGIIPKEFWPDLGIPEDTPPDGTIPLSFMQKYNSGFTFSVTQQLFDGLWIVGVSSAQLYVDLSRQMHEKTEIDIREAVTQAYYAVLISERYKQVLQENLDNTEQLYNETKIYLENGFREQQDVDQLQILLKNAENEMIRADRELAVSKIVLKYTMGYDLDADITLVDNLNVFVLPLVEETNQFEMDFSSHIDYQLAHSNFQVSEKLLRMEKVAYLPRLNAFYNYGRNTFTNSANVFNESWYPSSMVGLQATIQLFNSGNKRSKVQQAKMEWEKAQTDLQLTQLTLQKDYLTAAAEMETARERFLNDRESRDLAKSILNKTQIKFNEGLVSSAELSQQESQYISAFQALVSSTLSLLQADLKLKKAAGAL